MHLHDGEAAACAIVATQSAVHAMQSRRLLVVGVALALAAMADHARAERWTLDPSVETRATYTDNAGFADQQQREADGILEVSPRIGLRGEGKRFRIVGNIGLTALTYVNGTADNRYLPAVDLAANLEAIERFFFIEAGITSRQTAESVFAPSPNSPADFNTATTTQYRLVPSFEGRLGGDVQYRLRSANSWTDVSGNGPNAGASYLGEHSLRVEHKPTPLGWALEGARTDTRFDSNRSDLPSATVDSVRLIVLYAFSPEFNAGLRSGYEKTNIAIDHDTQVIYGGEFSWKPSERTDMNGFWEKRFFGSGWRFSFNHRRPRVAWNVALSREVATLPQAFLTLPATNDLAALLDAAFTTRIPDPTERSRVVQDLMAREGLPNNLTSETRLFTNLISLVTSANASVTFIGVRNSLAFAVFSSKSEQLQDSVFTPLSCSNSPTTTCLVTQNVSQQGLTLTYSHQLSALTAANLTGSIVRSKGIGPDTGTQSKQRSVQGQVTRQLAPKTSAFAGVRLQKFDSNVPGVPTDLTEHAGFVGLSHRF